MTATGSWHDIGYAYRMQAPGYVEHGSDKWDHGYLPHYERVLGGRDVRRVLEIGVQYGASLDLWCALFPDAEVVGIDTDPRCAVHSTARHRVVIGDAASADVGLAVDGTFDLIVDDGDHLAVHTFANLARWASRLTPGGVYVVEDAVFGSTSWIQSVNDTIDALLFHGLTPLAVERSNVEWVAHRHYGGMMAVVFADQACPLPEPPKVEP